MKEFLNKWSNWWILNPKRKQLDDAFEKELNELIEREVALHKRFVGRSYSFVEPKFFVDDKVWFKDNKGFEMEGKIVGVETHWSKKNESYHIYSLYKEGRKRLMHVGERNIIYRYDF